MSNRAYLCLTACCSLIYVLQFCVKVAYNLPDTPTFYGWLLLLLALSAMGLLTVWLTSLCCGRGKLTVGTGICMVINGLVLISSTLMAAFLMLFIEL